MSFEKWLPLIRALKLFFFSGVLFFWRSDSTARPPVKTISSSIIIIYQSSVLPSTKLCVSIGAFAQLMKTSWPVDGVRWRFKLRREALRSACMRKPHHRVAGGYSWLFWPSSSSPAPLHPSTYEVCVWESTRVRACACVGVWCCDYNFMIVQSANQVFVLSNVPVCHEMHAHDARTLQRRTIVCLCWTSTSPVSNLNVSLTSRQTRKCMHESQRLCVLTAANHPQRIDLKSCFIQSANISWNFFDLCNATIVIFNTIAYRFIP